MEPVEQVTIDGINNATQTGNVWGMVLYLIVIFGVIYLLTCVQINGVWRNIKKCWIH